MRSCRKTGCDQSSQLPGTGLVGGWHLPSNAIHCSSGGTHGCTALCRRKDGKSRQHSVNGYPMMNAACLVPWRFWAFQVHPKSLII